jgi:hypothetical protein
MSKRAGGSKGAPMLLWPSETAGQGSPVLTAQEDANRVEDDSSLKRALNCLVFCNIAMVNRTLRHGTDWQIYPRNWGQRIRLYRNLFVRGSFRLGAGARGLASAVLS